MTILFKFILREFRVYNLYISSVLFILTGFRKSLGEILFVNCGKIRRWFFWETKAKWCL